MNHLPPNPQWFGSVAESLAGRGLLLDALSRHKAVAAPPFEFFALPLQYSPQALSLCVNLGYVSKRDSRDKERHIAEHTLLPINREDNYR